jgi:hypothetical protein
MNISIIVISSYYLYTFDVVYYYNLDDVNLFADSLFSFFNNIELMCIQCTIKIQIVTNSMLVLYLMSMFPENTTI